MNSSEEELIVQKLSEYGLNTFLLTKDEYLANNPWAYETYETLQTWSTNAGIILALNTESYLSGVAIWKPKTIVLSASSFPDAMSLGYIIAKYIHDKEPIQHSPAQAGKKSCYTNFYDENGLPKYIDLALAEVSSDSDIAKNLKQIASLFIFFLYLHESAHIHYRHGSRNDSIEQDAAVSSRGKFNSEKDAKEKHARELVCDSYALKLFLTEYVKHFLPESESEQIKYLSWQFAVIGLKFYFMEGTMGRNDFPLRHYPPSEFRMQHLYMDLIYENVLGLSEFVVHQVVRVSKKLTQKVLEDVFNDPIAKEWMSNKDIDTKYADWYENHVFPILKDWAPYQSVQCDGASIVP
ncbi:hypothetical protein [Vibrio fluvialis]|uniref:hypothetical protein n=1 Tax=Vibrio fluvialis TaxID=676 RepID=UPI0028DF6B0A|nr:hypothetical protein [Vibrio fluvialis]MDT8866665.1 hypothetical protein [Vibrio fluvialis]MDT8874433.1 hypothetical protein [Vibrio fluvialis]